MSSKNLGAKVAEYTEIFHSISEFGVFTILRNNHNPLFFLFVIKQDEEFHERFAQECWYYLDEEDTKNLYEELEALCGGRRERDRLEAEYGIDNKNRAKPGTNLPKRLQIKEQRTGYTKFIAGFQANNNAVLEMREEDDGKRSRSIRFVIEETSKERMIDEAARWILFNHPDTDEDEEIQSEKDLVSIAELDIFQIISLVETLEKLLPARTRYDD